MRKVALVIVCLILLTGTPVVSFADSGSTIDVYLNTISSDDDMCLIIKSDGTLWGEGREMGDGGGFRDYRTMKKLMDGVKQVAGNNMILKNDGTVWTWGDNFYGEIGNGVRTDFNFSMTEEEAKSLNRDQPTPVKVLDDVKYIASNEHTCYAIKSDDSLWVWGSNFQGIGLMPEDTRYILTPTKVYDDVKQVAVGTYHALILINDGTLFAVGQNEHGVLGLGTCSWDTGERFDAFIPEKVMDDVRFISAGFDTSYAIKNDNSLWSWGYAWRGPLGTGSPADQYLPVKIMEDVRYVSGNGTNVMAIRLDGSLWGWGMNGYKGLRDNGLSDVGEDDIYIPFKIMTGVAEVYTSTTTATIIKEDGSLWVRGYNWWRTGKKDIPGWTKVIDGARTLASVDTPITSMPYVTTATLSKSNITLNGEKVDLCAYTIGGSNYFKLRDIAYLLQDTDHGFSVGYDESTKTVKIVTDKAYSPNGDEMKTVGVDNIMAIRSFNPIKINDKEETMEVYGIGGSNYIKLRDLGDKIGFGVNWDANTKSIDIQLD
jgi:hypothetical protein